MQGAHPRGSVLDIGHKKFYSRIDVHRTALRVDPGLQTIWHMHLLIVGKKEVAHVRTDKSSTAC